MWRFVALVVALVAGVGAVVWYYRAPTDGGRPVRVVARNDDRWLDDLLSRSPKDVEAATAELEQRGTAALPLIRRTLQDPSGDPAHRKAALKASAILGARAAEAIPDVANALQERDFAPEAAIALSFMGSAAVPTLREAIKSDEPAVRREALRSLGKLRERASIDPRSSSLLAGVARRPPSTSAPSQSPTSASSATAREGSERSDHGARTPGIGATGGGDRPAAHGPLPSPPCRSRSANDPTRRQREAGRRSHPHKQKPDRPPLKGMI